MNEVILTNPSPNRTSSRKPTLTYNLQSTFTFDKKIGYILSGTSEKQTSYFYLNTQNGMVGMDTQALAEMANLASAEGADFWVITPDKDVFMYVSGDGRKMAMKIHTGEGLLYTTMASEFSAKQFDEQFKATGKTSDFGVKRQFKATEYSGNSPLDATPMSIWISSTNAGVVLNPAYLEAATGPMGLGFVRINNTTKLIVSMAGEGVSASITSIENITHRFSGAGYQTISVPGVK